MASSITRPIAAARPPSVIRLKLSPIDPEHQNRHRDRHRNNQPGDQRRRPVAQEEEENDAGQDEPDEDGVAHACDRVPHQLRLVVEGLKLHARAAACLRSCATSAATASATATVLLEGWRAMFSSTAFLPFAVTVV